MKSILIYERTIAGKTDKEVIVDDRIEIEDMLNSDILMSDKKVIHIEHDIYGIHIW